MDIATIKEKKQEIISCKKYPNCNAFKKVGVGDTVCGKAMLCQIHMNYIDFIENMTEELQGTLSKFKSSECDKFLEDFLNS